MKTVYNPIEKETNRVSLENLSVTKYYGFILAGNSPGMIVRNKDRTFNSMFFLNFTSGNVWGKFETLKDCVENLLNHNNRYNPPEVFEFDTFQELFEWAATQK